MRDTLPLWHIATDMPFWKVFVDFVFSTPEGMRETSIETVFAAASRQDATRAVAAWAENRLPVIQLGSHDAFIACVKLYGYVIHPPCPDGFIRTGITGCLFEWKHDTAGMSLACAVEAKCRTLDALDAMA